METSIARIRTIEEVTEEYGELRNFYPELTLKQHETRIIICGPFKFKATYKGTTLYDIFDIEIDVPSLYPQEMPLVSEIGGRIESNFHKNPDSDILCLGTPIALFEQFFKQPSLLGFVNLNLVPYLFSFCYKKQFGKMPFGELEHAGKGIYQDYSERLSCKKQSQVIEFLKILSRGKYKHYNKCPCGSQKDIKCCHGDLLDEMIKSYPPAMFKYEYKTAKGR